MTVPKFRAANEQHGFVDLRHLTQLKTLKVLAEDFPTEFDGADAMRRSMRQCPATLEKLAIEVQSFCCLDDVAVSLEHVLGTTLAHLTCLELTDAWFLLDKGSLACFTNLRSLSFKQSQVHAAVDDAANLTWLSGLTTLNLTRSTWFNLKDLRLDMWHTSLTLLPLLRSKDGLHWKSSRSMAAICLVP